MPTIAPVKVLAAARPHVAALDATTDAAAKAVIDETIRAAAAVDGDRCLDGPEAEAIAQALAQVKPQGGPLSLQEAQQLKSAVDTRIGTLRSARPKTTDVAFTSQGNATTVFRAKILGAIDETLQRANGKKVDINVMIFAFTDEVLAAELTKRCRDNANMTLRILTDWSMLAESGDRQPPKLARLGLPNLVVKFKKDNPYTWNAARNEPAYNHGATEGLNHHKGFVTLVDGRPEKMTLGSFNWSEQAMETNYENLMVLDRKDVDNRAVMDGYQKEFEGFWNDDNAALTYREALQHREDSYAKLHAANGQPYTPRAINAPATPDPLYAATDVTQFFDVNSFQDRDAHKLSALVGKTVANKIWTELQRNGRFDSLDELIERVPLAASKRALLAPVIELGEGGLSINTATVDELDRAGFSRTQATKLVAHRDAHGSFESLDEAVNASGIARSRLDVIGINLSDDEARGFYSARTPGGQATTGWSPDNRANVNVANGPDRATVTSSAPTLAAAVADMARRAPAGETFMFAMYGISPNSPEFAEIEAAARRGVKIRAVLYTQYNKPAIDALKALKAQGFDVDVRVLSRVMHEKLGVCGDDSFNGSANMSTSSITKHTEDRFLFRNMPDLAAEFRAEIERLWALGRAP